MALRADRADLLRRYLEGTDAVRKAVEGLTDAQLDQPAADDPANGWTARQIVHHLADSEMTSAIRLRRLLAEDGEAYEVHISIDDERCTIRVKDAGIGFDVDAREQARHDDVTAESGRGLDLIRALVDRVKFISKPEVGVIVHLEKELEFDDDHPVRRTLIG